MNMFDMCMAVSVFMCWVVGGGGGGCLCVYVWVNEDSMAASIYPGYRQEMHVLDCV